jgi:hypothetical protein
VLAENPYWRMSVVWQILNARDPKITFNNEEEHVVIFDE